jgi:hypothetical protein
MENQYKIPLLGDVVLLKATTPRWLARLRGSNSPYVLPSSLGGHRSWTTKSIDVRVAAIRILSNAFTVLRRATAGSAALFFFFFFAPDSPASSEGAGKFKSSTTDLCSSSDSSKTAEQTPEDDCNVNVSIRKNNNLRSDQSSPQHTKSFFFL